MAPVKKTYSAKMNVVIHQSHTEGKSVKELVLNEDNSLEWNRHRFTDPTSSMVHGFSVSSQYSDSLIHKHLRNGIRNRGDLCRYEGDSSVSPLPLFNGGVVVERTASHLLSSAGYFQESIIFSDLLNHQGLSNRKVQLSHNPSLGGVVRSFQWERLSLSEKKQINRFTLVSEFSEFSDLATSKLPGAAPSLANANPESNEMALVESGGSLYLVFNKDPGAFYSTIPTYVFSTTQERSLSLEEIKVREGNDLYSKVFPWIEDSIDLVSDDGTGTYALWTKVVDFTGSGSSDKHYTTTSALGRIEANPEFDASDYTFYLEYTAFPVVEYLIENKEAALYHVPGIDKQRIATDTDSGSFIYTFRGDTSEDVEVLITGPSLAKDSSGNFSNSYYGALPHRMKLHAQDRETNNPIVGRKFSLSITEGIGLLKHSKKVEVRTNSAGDAFFSFTPPSLFGNESFVLLSRGAGATTLDSTVSHYFAEPLDRVYVYGIYKDDPLIGRNPQGNEIGPFVVWSPTILNGVWRLLSKYSSNAYHPHLNTKGAFVPYNPQSTSANLLTFDASLTQDDAFDVGNNLGGYVARGPRYSKIEVSILSNSGKSPSKIHEFRITTSFEERADGVLQLSSAVYPFGWRLPGLIDPSSQLGGNLFMTINEVTGKHSILFEPSSIAEPFTTEVPFKVTVV